MARTDNLTNYLTDVATAIKSKKGDSTPILASNFDTEITNLPSGGGSAYDYFVEEETKTGGVDAELLIKKIPRISVPNVTTFGNMFNGWSNLEEVDFTGINTTNVTTMSSMFYSCSSLKSIDMSGKSCYNVSNISNVFSGCSNIETIHLGKFGTTLTNCASAFINCAKLNTIVIDEIDTSNVTNFTSMFNGCKKLKNFDTTILDMSDATNISSMFSNCNELTKIELNSLVGSNIALLNSVFSNCSKATEILLPNFHPTVNITNVSSTFNKTTLLEKLDLRSFDFSKITVTNGIQNMLGSSNTSGIPADCLLIVADSTQKNLVETALPRLTNVKTVTELGE